MHYSGLLLIDDIITKLYINTMFTGESEKKPQRGDFKDVMLWAKKLGAAAKLGISVYMRKPYHLSLFEPTPVSDRIN